MYKLFLKKYFLFLIFIAIVCVPIILFLYKTQEVASVEDIVKKQMATKAIYGTALNDNMFAYKLEIVKQTKPEIIAIGSSRVMQFREEFFSKKFITTGGATNYMNEGVDFLNEVLKVHKPKVIILGLDIWWFNNNYQQPSRYMHAGTTSILSIDKIYKPILWLANGKIDKKCFLNTILQSEDSKNSITNYTNIGISALKTSDGFRSDGSYFYSKLIFGIEKPGDDVKFQDTLNRIKQGNARFEYGDKVSKDRWNDLLRFLNICKKNNIKVIIFIPPVANKIIEKMNEMKNEYAYVTEFRTKVISIGGFDYHDPKIISSSDCEFVNGFHGGDVTYQRILLDLADKNEYLKNHVDVNLLKQLIDKNKNKALTIFDTDKNKYFKSETDFLEIGCKK